MRAEHAQSKTALKPVSWSTCRLSKSATIRPLFGGRNDEEVKVYGRADRVRVASGRGRCFRRSRGTLPKKIRVDNGTEFTSKRLDQWAYLSGVRLDFSRPGKPTDNGLIEAFNGRLRAECLNENWFLSLADAKEKVAAWKLHYNTERPHSALGSLAPEEFAASSGQASLAG